MTRFYGWTGAALAAMFLLLALLMADLRFLRAEPPDEKKAVAPPPASHPAAPSDVFTPKERAQSQRMLAAAWNWLLRHQMTDGRWSFSYETRCSDKSCVGAGTDKVDMAASALALLTFLAGGHTWERKGPYQWTIHAGMFWMMRNQRPDGDLRHGEENMETHALAALVLCEGYAATKDQAVGKAAQAAVRFIERTQDASGGWEAMPDSTCDTSAVVRQITALRSAQLAGLAVQPDSLKAAQQWLDSVAKGQHAGLYAGKPGGKATPTMTAAGMLVRQYRGDDLKTPGMLEGKQFLLTNLANGRNRNTWYWFYALQAFQKNADGDWNASYRKIHRELIPTQAKEGCAAGSWDPNQPAPDIAAKGGGRLLTTCLSALCLEVELQHLELFKSAKKLNPAK